MYKLGPEVGNLPMRINSVSIDTVTSVSAYMSTPVPALAPCFLLLVGDNRVIPLAFEDSRKADFGSQIDFDVGSFWVTRSAPGKKRKNLI